ncbi:ATP-binding protein [Streptomyces sp. 549]|uniref:ATP-binding protein n=1 Tax=Streptomyces sp. 549 TaxID=3049076 RepID=UPI0024C2863B|nr:ATP-binding protein [Streptomyces sp. 549]MDK1476526.1 ATP-binding protein [Streptomyces sp. 549]
MTAHTLPARRRTERPPLKPPLLALLVAAAVTGAGVAVAVLLSPASMRTPVASAAGAVAVLLCAAAVTVVRQGQRAQQLREDIADLEHESARLAERTVPALVERLREGTSAETALADLAQPPLESHRLLLRNFAEELGRSESGRASAMAACASAAGRMQALATGMLADLRDMEHRHSDEAVLGDLLHIDHRTAQAGRLADSIAVLTGARSGRRWAKPIVMESIMRGAMGRIAGYQRVRLHSTTEVAIAGHAAEGVMHALAELLDNAANFSPPTAEVHVYVEEVPAGVVITVEDSGLVMSDFALRRAERAVSGEPLDLTSLSGTRLGLAVVGCLARKHGLTVSFRPSARGGTGVLVRVPQELITRPRAGDSRPRSVEPRPVEARSVEARPGAETGQPTVAEGLPRQRGASSATATARAPEPLPAPREPWPDLPSSPLPSRSGTTPPATPASGTPAHGTPAHGTPAHGTPATPGGLPRRSAASGGEPDPAHAPAPDLDGPPEYGESGLPKRRRGRTLATARQPVALPRPDAAKPGRTAADSAARFGTFRRALKGRTGDPARTGDPESASTPDASTPDASTPGASALDASSAPPTAPAAPHASPGPHTSPAPYAPAAPDSPAAPATEPASSQPEDDPR